MKGDLLTLVLHKPQVRFKLAVLPLCYMKKVDTEHAVSVSSLLSFSFNFFFFVVVT